MDNSRSKMQNALNCVIFNLIFIQRVQREIEREITLDYKKVQQRLNWLREMWLVAKIHFISYFGMQFVQFT